MTGMDEGRKTIFRGPPSFKKKGEDPWRKYGCPDFVVLLGEHFSSIEPK